MHKGRSPEELSVIEAVDNLSNMSEIDLKVSIDTEMGEEFGEEINWRDPRQALRNEPALKETFRVVHRYLQNIVRQERASLKDTQTQKGIQAIMLIAQEAVHKMDRYAALYPDQYKPISHLKEYKDLEKYYHLQILERMPKKEEDPEEWEAHVEEGIEGLEAQKRGIKDLEGVRKDLYYELFFIKNESGKPYISRSLLRHIRLMGNFDELISVIEDEDPLLRIRELLDRELYEGAKEVLRLSATSFDDFYKDGMKQKKLPYIADLNKAIMALRMAANPKNLIENQSFKSCLEYYSDFHRFLRDAMKTPGYRKLIEGESDDPFSRVLLNLTHSLCCYFFMRIEPRKEALSLINNLSEKGEKMQEIGPSPKAEKKEMQIWEDLKREDENIRYLLKHYPNGPLLKTLDAFRNEEEFEGFDPLMHQNFPAQRFVLSQDQFHVTILHLPCPVKQEYINKCAIAEEFSGFLRFYNHEPKGDRHLMINLQDRTSWEEFSRCEALETWAKQAEYDRAFHVVGLPKDTDFYQQIHEYQQMSGAPVFIEQFLEQINSGTSCGYYFPDALSKKEITAFAKPALEVVHSCFFQGRNTLTVKDRLNFIEIFYQIFIFKMIEKFQCDSISFTCKDGIDTGAVQNALFYGFVELLSMRNPDKDQLIWMLYSSALLIRDRAVLLPRFKRGIIALEAIHESLIKDGNKIVKSVNQLYSNCQFPIEVQS